MKYEVIETVQTIQKNNGESFKVNKIKWNNNYKFDFRIWRKDVPTQGLVMTENETLAFCKELMAYIQGIDKAWITPEDYMFANNMEDIDLGQLLEEHPDCLKSLTNLKNLLADYFPGKERERFVLSTLHESGVLNRLKSLPEITVNDVRNTSIELENRYGIKRAYSVWGINTWCKALHLSIKRTESIPWYIQREQLRTEAFYVPCDNIISNSELQIVYNGARIGLQLENIITLHFRVKNRSDNSLKVRFVNAWSNGEEAHCDSEEIITATEERGIQVTAYLSRNSIEKLKGLEKTNGGADRSNRFRVTVDKLGEIRITLMYNILETGELYTAKEMILALGEKTV